MKIRLAVPLVGLAVSFALPIFSQQKEATLSEQDRQQLGALHKKWSEAENNNDAAALAALYTKDAVLCGGEGSGPHYGREAIEKHFAEGFKLFHFSNHVVTPDQYSPHVIGTSGNEVWVLGEWSMTIQSKNGGSPMQIKGNSLNIFVPDGDSWKALAILTNNAAPPPEPAKAK